MVHEVNKIKKRMKLDPNPTAHRKFLLSIEPIDQHRNHNIGQVGYVMDKYSINPIITMLKLDFTEIMFTRQPTDLMIQNTCYVIIGFA